MNIDEIEIKLKEHEKRISKLEASKNSVSANKDVGMDSIQALTDLLKESFFDQPRKYGQIIKQLKTNATFSAQVNYKTGLGILVKEKKLTRKTVEHQWVYFKNG